MAWQEETDSGEQRLAGMTRKMRYVILGDINPVLWIHEIDTAISVFIFFKLCKTGSACTHSHTSVAVNKKWANLYVPVPSERLCRYRVQQSMEVLTLIKDCL